MTQDQEKIKRLNHIIQLTDDSEISSIKNIVHGLIKIINDPKSTARDLKELIQIDPPLTARVLRLANSAYYSPRNKIGEITQAIIWVGYNAIKELAISQKVCEIFSGNEVIGGYSRNSLWKHSLAVALLGKLIYRREFGQRGENAYVAGLLHEIGIIVKDQFFPDEFRATLMKSGSEKLNMVDAENEISGYDHTEIGRAIMEHWQIPREIAAAINNHHSPERSPEEYSKLTCTLYVADYFCQRREIGFSDSPFNDKERFKNIKNKLNLGPNTLDLLIEDVEHEVMKMADQGFF